MSETELRPKDRRDLWSLYIMIVTGLSFGVTARFWRSVLTPPPELTIVLTPGIYWLVGLVLSAYVLQLVRRHRDRYSARVNWTLTGLCTANFASYFCLPIYMILMTE